jgi:hypothetical protein
MVLARAETSVHFVHTFRIRTRAVSLPLHACVSLKPAHASGCFRAPRTVSVPASPTHAHADQVARCLALHSRAPAARERAASGVNKICSEIGEQTRFATADFACAPAECRLRRRRSRSRWLPVSRLPLHVSTWQKPLRYASLLL